LTLNGYVEKDINEETGIKWAKSTSERWGINTATSKLENNHSDEVNDDSEFLIGEGSHCLDFNSPGAIILPNSSGQIEKIKKFVN